MSILIFLCVKFQEIEYFHIYCAVIPWIFEENIHLHKID